MVRIIANISALPNPPDAICLRVDMGVHQRLHPIIVKGIRFHQVDDVEFVGISFARVLDRKIKPF